MKKKTIGFLVGGLLLAGAAYYFIFRKKDNGFQVNSNNLDSETGNSTQQIVATDNGLELTETSSGDLLGSYNWRGKYMEFPMYNTGAPYTAYDNVAILQAFLLYESPDLVMPVDGKYGDLTAAAVYDQVNGMTDLGYGDENYDYEEVTQEYYDTFVTQWYTEFS